MKIHVKKSWYNENQISKLGLEGFYVYLKLRELETKGNEGTLYTSINYFYAYLSNTIKISKAIIIEYLRTMKQIKLINYERIYPNNDKLLTILLLDMPALTNHDSSTVLIIDTNELDNALNLGAKLKDISSIMHIKEKKPKNKIKTRFTSKEGYIYVITTNNIEFKIGRTKDISKRIGEYTKLPYDPEIICLFKVANMDICEKYLHDKFKIKRLRGEWFKLNSKDISYFSKELYIDDKNLQDYILNTNN